MFKTKPQDRVSEKGEEIFDKERDGKYKSVCNCEDFQQRGANFLDWTEKLDLVTILLIYSWRGVCYIPFLSQITFAFFILFHVNITFCERSQKGVNLDKFEIGVKELPSAGGKPNLWKSFRSINHQLLPMGKLFKLFPTSSSFMIGLLPRLKNFPEEKSCETSL